MIVSHLLVRSLVLVDSVVITVNHSIENSKRKGHRVPPDQCVRVRTFRSASFLFAKFGLRTASYDLDTVKKHIMHM